MNPQDKEAVRRDTEKSSAQESNTSSERVQNDYNIEHVEKAVRGDGMFVTIRVPEGYDSVQEFLVDLDDCGFEYRRDEPAWEDIAFLKNQNQALKLLKNSDFQKICELLDRINILELELVALRRISMGESDA